jgi:hypothetical protein
MALSLNLTYNMKKIFFLILFLFSLSPFSQTQVKGDFIWMSGTELREDGQAINGFLFDFNQKPMKVEEKLLTYGFYGSRASVCDAEGNLLFYSNGQGVLNADHQLMPNGDSLNWGLYTEWAWYYPELGYPGPQDNIILRDPAYEDGYYLIHKYIEMNLEGRNPRELWMSYIDLTKDQGKGDLIFKNEVLYNERDLLASFLTAIKHKNGRDWWIVQPLVNDSTFITFLLDDTGIHLREEYSTCYFFDGHRSSSSGTLKFSPDGTQLALYTYYDQLHVYDFDRATGVIDNHRIVEIYDPDEIDRELHNFGSVEWSPNGRFIYTASSEDLFQVDTWEEDMQDGVRLIDSYNGTLDPFTTRLFLMVQAPDCKIYMTPKNGSYSLHVINKPDELGTACDFVQNGIKLPNSNGGGLPNFPRFRVDEEEKCDSTISSVFGQAVYYRRGLKAYPNPSSGPLTIEIPENFSTGTLEIIDLRAGTVHRQKLDHPQEQYALDLGHLPAGVYHIEIYPEHNPERVFYGTQVVLSY